MDVVADASVILSCSREEALNETIPWLQHCLRRHSALEAARAKTNARATLLAVSCGMGSKEAGGSLKEFFAEMDTIIAAGSETEKRDGPTADEIAMFESIAQAAEANARQGK